MVQYKPLGITNKHSLAASGIEWMVNLASGCIVGLVFIPMAITLPVYLRVISLVICIGSLIAVSPPVIKKIMILLKKPFDQPLHYYDVTAWLITSTCLWIISGLTVAVIIKAFVPIEVKDLLFIIGAWSLSGIAGLLTLLLPSSFGVSELSFIALLSDNLPIHLTVIIVISIKILLLCFEFAVYFLFNIFNRTKGIPSTPPVQ